MKHEFDITTIWQYRLVLSTMLLAIASSASPQLAIGCDQSQANDCCGGSYESGLSEAHVVLIRGLAGYWPAATDLESEFRRQGVRNIKIVHGWNVQRTAQQICAERASGVASGPVIVVGYSLGGNDAVRMATWLKRGGVRIDVLTLIDTPYATVVPDNVDYCFNIYKSRPKTDWMPWFRGRPVSTAGPAGTLVNYDVRYYDPDETLGDLNHFVICSDQNIHHMVVQQVAAHLPMWGGPDHAVAHDKSPIRRNNQTDALDVTTTSAEAPATTSTVR